MSNPTSLIPVMRHISAVFILFFTMGISNAADLPTKSLGNLEMIPHSLYWNVKKVGEKIVATNLNSNQEFTVFEDSAKVEDDQIPPFSLQYEIVSLVGPVLSICEAWYSDSGVHPSYGSIFRVVNLDKGIEELTLTDIFDEAEVIKALLNDRVIRKSLGEDNPENILEMEGLSISELEGLDGGCEMSFSELNRSFAFHHVKGDVVAVRIGLRHGCEAMRGNFTQIGIYLQVSESDMVQFKRAEKNRMLMRHLWSQN